MSSRNDSGSVDARADSATAGGESNSSPAGGVSARAPASGPGAGAADANAELLAAHGDLRHRGLEIARRLRRRPLAGLSWAAPAGVDRFQPPHRIDQRLPVAVPRRIRALKDLGDRFERARRPRFGAREPRLEALDRRIERVRNPRRAAVRARPVFAARCVRGVPRPRRAARLRLHCLAAARVARGRPGRRSLRRANRQDACRRDGRLPRRRPEFAAPPPRSSTPSLCSCPRPSPAAANRRALQGRRRRTIVSAVVVKKRLRALRLGRREAAPALELYLWVVATFDCNLDSLRHRWSESRRGARITKARTQRRRRKERL